MNKRRKWQRKGKNQGSNIDGGSHRKLYRGEVGKIRTRVWTNVPPFPNETTFFQLRLHLFPPPNSFFVTFVTFCSIQSRRISTLSICRDLRRKPCIIAAQRRAESSPKFVTCGSITRLEISPTFPPTRFSVNFPSGPSARDPADRCTD